MSQPPPYAPPPGSWVIPAPPKRRRRWPWVLGGALLLVGLGVGLVILRLVNTYQGAEAELKTYLTALQNEDFATVQANLCDDLAGQFSTEDIQKQVDDADKALGKVTSFSVDGLSTNETFGGSSGSHTSAVARYTLQYTSGPQRHEALLVKEHGSWRLCGFR